MDLNTWPSNSPDLNPMDYFFKGVLEREVCSVSYRNIDELEASISKKWGKVNRADLVNACHAFRGR